MRIDDNSLRRDVQALEAQLRTQASEAERAANESRRSASEAEMLWDSMNFRERYLWGWFGGDTQKVARYGELQADVVRLNDESRKARQAAEGTEERVQITLHSWLETHDATYQKLLLPYHAVRKVKDAVASFLGKIDRALSEVDDAQSMETVDLFSSNKGIALLSSLENSEAEDAVRSVRRSVGAFQDALRDYNGFLDTYEAPELSAEIGDGLDLVFDLVFDGFDFMSIFTLSALDRAESDLRAARRKVEEVDRIVSAHLDTATRALETYKQQARLACAASEPRTTFLYQEGAPACPDCGSIMVRNGSCYKCLNCGTTRGCS